jgi:hypothetical protein
LIFTAVFSFATKGSGFEKFLKRPRITSLRNHHMIVTHL